MDAAFKNANFKNKSFKYNSLMIGLQNLYFYLLKILLLNSESLYKINAFRLKLINDTNH